MHRRKIVVIAGSGRTGSTLLSLLLTQHKDVFNLGQLRDLWGAWVADAACACGHGLQRCPVWGPAVRAAFGAEPAAELTRVRKGQQAFFADAGRLSDWSEAAVTTHLAEAHAAYLSDLGRLLDAVAGATGMESFVDASKSPQMALAFSLAPGTDARVLNLVRDPRAVAVSWKEKEGLAAAWKQSRAWAERQRALQAWSRTLGDRFRQLRYEAFAAGPAEAVAGVCGWAGLPSAEGVFPAPGRATIDWDSQHLYPPANERVLAERRTEAAIRPAQVWRERRHRLTRLLALTASWPEGWRYVRGAGSS